MDAQCDLALQVAYKLDPSSTFTFSVRKIKLSTDERRGWQVSLLQDKGDKSAPFIFASGMHETTYLAAKAMLARLKEVVSKRHTELAEAAAKSAAKFEASTTSSLEAVELLKDVEE